MEAVSNAIRSALEKGDARDRTFREKVYRQTLSALDRSLETRPNLSAEDKRQRREQVKAAIVEIEREYLGALPRSAPAPDVAVDRQEPEFFPRVEPDERRPIHERPEISEMPVGEVRIPPPRRKKERSSLGKLVLPLVLIAALLLAGWWALGSGVLQSSSTRDNATNPSASGPGGGDPTAQTGFPQTEATGDWISIFSPDDPTAVSAPAGASVEQESDGDDEFVRIGSAGAAISFHVEQSVMEQLAGRQAIFSLSARSEEGQETQISISCDFGALGDCGRTRYVVGPQQAEYLFEVAFPDGDPGAGGTISIIPDVEGQGRLLDVFSLSVSAAN